MSPTTLSEAQIVEHCLVVVFAEELHGIRCRRSRGRLGRFLELTHLLLVIFILVGEHVTACEAANRDDHEWRWIEL